MRSIVISHMCSAIHVYRICRNVEAGEGFLKHRIMFTKDVPVILRDTITSFASSNSCKLKRTVDVGIKMCDI
jgi:hypothetical protein